MPLMNRCGCAAVSMRVNFTALLSGLVDTNNRPMRVAAQSGDPAALARPIDATYDPALLVPKAGPVKSSPTGTQSPQLTVKSPVNSLQCKSKYARGPPLS